MKPGAGKGKGSGFERDVCRILTQWITGKTHPELFWRSANSGAKATMDRRASRQAKMHGDIVAVDPQGEWLTEKFSIECKFYKQGSFMDFFNEKSQIRKWWEQADHDAKECGKIPLMIFKFNHTPIFVASIVYFEESILRWWINPPVNTEKPVHIALLNKVLDRTPPSTFKKNIEMGAWF
jgi:hypothetical protein